jgi:hypothetical protein
MRLIGLAVMKAVALVLAGGAVSSALAFKEPSGFRGVPWGATEDALRDKLGESSANGVLSIGCEAYRPEERWMGDRSCVTVDAVYTFRANRFVRVTLMFPARDFGRIAAIFAERYGTPTKVNRGRYQTQGGLEALNEIQEWGGPSIVITLRRFGSRITDGTALLTTRSELQELTRLRSEQTKGGAKGLLSSSPSQ